MAFINRVLLMNFSKNISFVIYFLPKCYCLLHPYQPLLNASLSIPIYHYSETVNSASFFIICPRIKFCFVGLPFSLIHEYELIRLLFHHCVGAGYNSCSGKGFEACLVSVQRYSGIPDALAWQKNNLRKPQQDKNISTT